MNNVLIYHRIIMDMGNYVDTHTESITTFGKGGVSEQVIKTPFLLRDETNLELRLRKEGDDTILHDNSHLYQYLLDYGIRVDSNSLRQKKYHDFVSILMERKDFGYDSDWKWFYKICTSKTSPEDIWRFVHSLQMISDLVMTKTLKNHQR